MIYERVCDDKIVKEFDWSTYIVRIDEVYHGVVIKKIDDTYYNGYMSRVINAFNIKHYDTKEKVIAHVMGCGDYYG